MKKIKLDNLDKKIINLLLLNSTLSYREISAHVKSSAATVMNRVKRLQREGVIKAYTLSIDYEKVGYDIEALIEVRISKGKLFRVEKEIANHKNVFAVYDLTGDFDAVILARFKNRRELDTFIKKIQTYEFIERTNTRIILNTIKEKQIGV